MFLSSRIFMASCGRQYYFYLETFCFIMYIWVLSKLLRFLFVSPEKCITLTLADRHFCCPLLPFLTFSSLQWVTSFKDHANSWNIFSPFFYLLSLFYFCWRFQQLESTFLQWKYWNYLWYFHNHGAVPPPPPSL